MLSRHVFCWLLSVTDVSLSVSIALLHVSLLLIRYVKLARYYMGRLRPRAVYGSRSLLMRPANTAVSFCTVSGIFIYYLFTHKYKYNNLLKETIVGLRSHFLTFFTYQTRLLFNRKHATCEHIFAPVTLTLTR